MSRKKSLPVFKAVLLLFSFFSSPLVFAQPRKEQNFKTAVTTIVAAFSKGDSMAVAKYIHPEKGLYLLDAVGVYEHFVQVKTVGFKNEAYPAVLFTMVIGLQPMPLQYAKLPTYSCDAEAWSKRGFFVDTTYVDHRLSKIAKTRVRLKLQKISPALIQSLYSLEAKSRRIVANDSSGKELVFYLSYLQGKWYLTALDYLTSDCSA